MKQIVFATNNLHKLQEAREIASGKLHILSLSDIGCADDIPETSPTLEGNALQKARWIYERYGYDCFADDTGLMVQALGGAPGVYTARYAGEGCNPSDNVKKLLNEMSHIADCSQRKATFATAIAFIEDGGMEHLFKGEVEGTIALRPEGEGGFGYDPVFVPKETGIPFACMSPEEKNSISHRGRAMRKFMQWLTEKQTNN